MELFLEGLIKGKRILLKLAVVIIDSLPLVS
jgi:hypothetical protein